MREWMRPLTGAVPAAMAFAAVRPPLLRVTVNALSADAMRPVGVDAGR